MTASAPTAHHEAGHALIHDVQEQLGQSLRDPHERLAEGARVPRTPLQARDFCQHVFGPGFHFEVGKLADLVVLSADPSQMTGAEIRSAALDAAYRDAERLVCEGAGNLCVRFARLETGQVQTLEYCAPAAGGPAADAAAPGR